MELQIFEVAAIFFLTDEISFQILFMQDVFIVVKIFSDEATMVELDSSSRFFALPDHYYLIICFMQPSSSPK